MPTCPNCHYSFETEYIPPEPPVGTWIKDRFGGTTLHQNGGWGEPGLYPTARWDAMWEARGPLVVCGPWGKDLR